MHTNTVIEIKYSASSHEFGCMAGTQVGDEYICAAAQTWAEARARLLEKVRAYLGRTSDPVPEPETVEL